MDIGALGVYAVLFLALYFEVFLLISFFERRPRKKSAKSPRHYPKVAVIVPCFNEELTLRKTVDSLLALRYPKQKLEVLIVDDGSTDATRSIGERLARAHDRVRYFRKQNGGKYTALNFGIAQSDAKLVGCLDADSFVAPDALREVIKQLEENPEAYAAIPAMHVHSPKNILERMQLVEYTFGIFVKKMFDNLAAISVLPGPFSIYRREVFDIVGPFRHAHQTEDMEMAFRMHKHGLPILNAHTALVYTTVPKTLRTLLKQRTRWTQGFLQNSRDYVYMYGNPRYGNFGMLVLPFGLVMFFGALYTASYLFYTIVSSLTERAFDLYLTGVPPVVPKLPTFNWFFLETSMLTFLIIVIMILTFISILLGRRIGESKLGWRSLVSYFAVYGFIAPLWLARALWGAMLARESAWR